ncbi:hypothetical protein ACQ4M3_23455 [Leptolyngbya sp. AN03gr2]|uniref:hypothetical protein n=1 Tax=unclassified Leptolyngbya TaxID=2650499 RepID=UPI003D314760
MALAIKSYDSLTIGSSTVIGFQHNYELEEEFQELALEMKIIEVKVHDGNLLYFAGDDLDEKIGEMLIRSLNPNEVVVFDLDHQLNDVKLFDSVDEVKDFFEIPDPANFIPPTPEEQLAIEEKYNKRVLKKDQNQSN